MVFRCYERIYAVKWSVILVFGRRKMKNYLTTKLNPYFEILHDDSLFPLTPALSLGERENRSQLFGEATADFCAAAYEF
jgi:hypothetical protein